VTCAITTVAKILKTNRKRPPTDEGGLSFSTNTENSFYGAEQRYVLADLACVTPPKRGFEDSFQNAVVLIFQMVTVVSHGTFLRLTMREQMSPESCGQIRSSHNREAGSPTRQGKLKISSKTRHPTSKLSTGRPCE
jgi:hypothetical protein